MNIYELLEPHEIASLNIKKTEKEEVNIACPKCESEWYPIKGFGDKRKCTRCWAVWYKEEQNRIDKQTQDEWIETLNNTVAKEIEEYNDMLENGSLPDNYYDT